MKNMKAYLKRALVITLALLLICGIVYPLALTALGKIFFPGQAEGSLVKVGDKVVGSELIGQQFEGEQYFQGRLSAVNYNTYTEKEKEEGDYGGVASGSYNQAPTSEELKERTSQAAADFKKRYKDATGEEFTGEIPADLVTASGSGLDPDISPESAKIQIPIVAANSGLSEEEVAQIVEDHTSRKVLGIFGEERVNVLKCNLDIAELTEEALP